MIEKIADDDGPRRREYIPTFREDCVRLTLMSEAVNDSTLRDGESVTQRYYEEEGIIVIDLPDGEDEPEQ